MEASVVPEKLVLAETESKLVFLLKVSVKFIVLCIRLHMYYATLIENTYE